MTFDQHQAHAEILELRTTADNLKRALANERQIADELRQALNELMKNFVTSELDPRTDELIRNAIADWREARQTYLNE